VTTVSDRGISRCAWKDVNRVCFRVDAHLVHQSVQNLPDGERCPSAHIVDFAVCLGAVDCRDNCVSNVIYVHDISLAIEISLYDDWRALDQVRQVYAE